VRTLLLVGLLLVTGCVESEFRESIPVTGVDGDTVTVVTRMLTVDGITVYRFMDPDADQFVYFASSGVAQSSYVVSAGKTSYTCTRQVPTVQGGVR
jgi:hypothetical protein